LARNFATQERGYVKRGSNLQGNAALKPRICGDEMGGLEGPMDER
jgi:hypothetical protein